MAVSARRLLTPNPQNLPVLETGTGLAKYTISKSARPFKPNPPVTGHGGARNSADRTSTELSASQVRALMVGIRRASAKGLPLNRHCTIHWERGGLPDAEAARAVGAFLTLVRDWLRKGGHPFAAVWVRENDDGDGSKGSHVHILLYLPAGVRWDGWRNRRWVGRVTGKPYVTGTICTRVIGRTRTAAWTAPAAFYENLGVVAGYLAKGASLETVSALGLDRCKAGGRIIGKRWGRSQSLRG
jgi:hypothetical protein